MSIVNRQLSIEKVESRNDILLRTYIVLAAITGLGAIVFLRAAQVQVWEGKKWRAMADSLYVAMKPVEAPRGNIYAEDMSLMATSLPYYEVRWDATVIAEDTFQRYINDLANLLATKIDNGKTPGAWREMMVTARTKKDRYLLIGENMSYPQLKIMEQFPIFSKGRFKGGFVVTQQNKRQHPFQLMARRALGRYEISPSGDTTAIGIEGYYNEYLAGQDGMQRMERIGGGAWIPLDNVASVEPKQGRDIVTTLDINIQDVAESALLRSLQQYDAKWGCVIVMDVKTGAIKAMSNLGRQPDGTYFEDYNYAIAQSAEPGSTFKLATMMSLLEDDLIDLDDTIDINFGKQKFFDINIEDAVEHGITRTSIRHAFEISSNVGMVHLVEEAYAKPGREKRFLKNLESFRLGQKTDIKLDGEGKPYIKTRDESGWNRATTIFMSHGYELLITPLQMLSFYNAVANQGRYMQPYIVKEVMEYGKVAKTFKPKVLDRGIASTETLDKAKELLTGVINNGTAKEVMKDMKLQVAGKTGTAVMNYMAYRAGLEPKKYQASFVGFFPADKPLYSCIVVISNPTYGLYGGIVAAPVFRQIAERTYSLRHDVLPPLNASRSPKLPAGQLPSGMAGFKRDLKQVLFETGLSYEEKSQNPWAYLQAKGDTLRLLERTTQEALIPNVVGMGLRDAVYLMENRGIKVRAVGVGKVRSQSVRPGQRARDARNITLILG